MQVELNYTDTEKETIANWKQSLPNNPNRRFKYQFMENLKRNAEGYKLYKYEIITDDGHRLTVAHDVEL